MVNHDNSGDDGNADADGDDNDNNIIYNKEFNKWINFNSYDSDSICYDIEDCDEIQDDDDDDSCDNLIEISSNIYDYFCKINSINLFKKIKLIIKQFYS